MRAVITRVKSASVSIAGSVVGEIGHGLLILLGVGPDDTPELCEKLADKALGLRIFCDEAGKMNRSLADIGGCSSSASSRSMPTAARASGRASRARLCRSWPSRCMSSSCRSAAAAALRRSTAGSAPICLSPQKTTAPSPSCSIRTSCSSRGGADPGKPQTPLPTDDCRERRPRRPVGHPANFRPLCRPHALPNLTVAALSERLAGWKVIGRHRRPYPPCRGGALPTGTGCR